MAKMFHDAPDFPVFALSNRHCKPRIAGHLPVEFGDHLTIGDAVNGDAFGQTGKPLLIHMALHPQTIFAAPTSRRQFKVAGQITIIGQQQ